MATLLHPRDISSIRVDVFLFQPSQGEIALTCSRAWWAFTLHSRAPYIRFPSG
jgi:hypothetical protein